MACLAFGAEVVAGFFDRFAEHYPYAAFALAIAPVAIAVGGYFGLDRLRWWRFHRGVRRHTPGLTRPTELRRPSGKLAAPFVILTVFALLGAQSGSSAHDVYIRAYCQYGAVSDAQLEHCMTHVGTDYINGLDTQAARFARGENSDCLEDSGPFCKMASGWNGITEDPNAP